MKKPDATEISNFHRYFAIQCNNEFWQLSEQELSKPDMQRILSIVYAALYHWREAGTEKNIQLANLAIARAYCINESPNSMDYATQAFNYFDETGEDWIQAFTNAVLSHAFCISGNFERAEHLYENAVTIGSNLSEGDRTVFQATFIRIPDPRQR